jgi:hypothetical protein
MPASVQGFTVASHFTRSNDAVRATYDAILKASRLLGPVRVEPKKTSIHLVRDTAFAGVATRKDVLILTLKSDHSVPGPRVHKGEQASRNRWHLQIRLTDPADVDSELREWLAHAYDIAGD